MKVLIDDFRLILPNGEHPDIIARNYWAGRMLLVSLGRRQQLPAVDLFIDHDLGSAHQQETGYNLICMVESEVLERGKLGFRPRSITCVSDNGSGRTSINLAIESIYNRPR